MRVNLIPGAMLVAASVVLGGQQNPYVGRWNITGTGADTDKVYFLEVTQNGDRLEGRFLNRTAHATPLAWIRVEGKELVFQYGRGEGVPADPVMACGPIYRAHIESGKLIGSHTPEPCNLPPRGAAAPAPAPAPAPRPPAKPINWIGVRQPVWPPSNANANHTTAHPSCWSGRAWDSRCGPDRRRSVRMAGRSSNGIIENNPPTYNPVSKAKFKDFKVETEFKLDADRTAASTCEDVTSCNLRLARVLRSPPGGRVWCPSTVGKPRTSTRPSPPANGRRSTPLSSATTSPPR